MSHLKSIQALFSVATGRETPFERAFLNNFGSPLLAEQAEVAKAGMEEAATTTSMSDEERPRSGTKQQRAEAEGTRGTGCGTEVKRRRGTEADRGGCNGLGKRKTPCELVAQRVPESCQAYQPTV